MKHILYFVSCISFLLFGGCNHKKETLRILQMNIWQEGTMVENGFEAIANEIIRLQPDVVCFSEVRNYQGVEFLPALRLYLQERGSVYYGETNSTDAGIISKYQIINQEVIYPLLEDRGSMVKAVMQIGRNLVTVYSAHLDYTHYACYLPRGYDGTTFQKIEHPILDVDSILKCNQGSKREEALKYLIADSQHTLSQGGIVILGGDFNEPSHLDWKADTKELRDHRGLIVPWPCSILLEQHGFKDAFREQYPNPITNPGITYPSYNPNADLKSLAWAADSDDRDRIDFIYYYPNSKIFLKHTQLIGPSESIKEGKIAMNDSEDSFILPIGVWPSDHKALLVDFLLN